MQIQDKVFGKLSYELFWTRKYDLPYFGQTQKFELIVQCYEDKAINDFQRASFVNFEEHKERYVRQAEAAIYEYYLSVCDDYRDMYGPENADALSPVITEVSQLKSILKPGIVVFPGNSKGKNVFGIGYECSWDAGNGVAVKFIDGLIVDVDFQHIL